jgi:hypothetical protein
MLLDKFVTMQEELLQSCNHCCQILSLIESKRGSSVLLTLLDLYLDVEKSRTKDTRSAGEESSDPLYVLLFDRPFIALLFFF